MTDCGGKGQVHTDKHPRYNRNSWRVSEHIKYGKWNLAQGKKVLQIKAKNWKKLKSFHLVTESSLNQNTIVVLFNWVMFVKAKITPNISSKLSQ